MPVPFADVTDELLRAVDMVHLVDPADGSFHRFVPCRPRPPLPPDAPVPSVEAVDVAVDRPRADQQLAELRRRIGRVHGLGG